MNRMLRLATLAACAALAPLAALAADLTRPTDVDGVEATMLEATRGDGGTVMVKWQLANKTGEKKQMTSERTGWYDVYRLTGDAYLLDLGNRTKYPVVKTPDRKPVAAKYGAPNKYAVIPPHKNVMLWAKFNAPPEGVRKIEVYLPGVSMPFEGVELR